MKAIIKEVKFNKKVNSKYGDLFSYLVKYNGKEAIYRSKSDDQKKFIPGQEAEFTEVPQTYTDNEGMTHDYLVIKPLNQYKQSNYGKALKKEQTRYSGFAVSYSKDLVVAGKLELEDLNAHAWTLFELMVEMDKSLES